MIVGVLENSTDKRDILVENDIKKLEKIGHNIIYIKDYEQIKSCDVIIGIEPNFDHIMPYSRKELIVICSFNTYLNYDKLEQNKNNARIMVLERMPRITKAQSMDILSSQNNLLGYAAVVYGATKCNKVFPLMTTAAGTIKPSKTVVLGAGVAGLQAIATAKRLGSNVYAFDVRSDAKEQVESVGGIFVTIPSTEDGATNDGYAKEMSNEYLKKQAGIIKDTIIDADLVITTALIQNKKAPILITKDMVHSMKNGSAIIDMAYMYGGNCECTEKNRTVYMANNVCVYGENLINIVSKDASNVFSKNIYEFIVYCTKNNKFFEESDDIVDAVSIK